MTELIEFFKNLLGNIWQGALDLVDLLARFFAYITIFVTASLSILPTPIKMIILTILGVITTIVTIKLYVFIKGAFK